jgi:hypothetical protein
MTTSPKAATHQATEDSPEPAAGGTSPMSPDEYTAYAARIALAHQQQRDLIPVPPGTTV